ncbi:MAG: hypothetical protein ACHP7D_02340 [Lysobacterales bacterium]
MDQVAAEAGVTPMQVRMVLGDRTEYAGYRTSFDFMAIRLNQAMDRLAARSDVERARALAQVPTKSDARDDVQR